VALGRTFRPEEHQPGADRVAVITYGLWQHCFGGDPDLIGRTIELDKEPFTVVGILPHHFTFPQLVPQPEVWTSAVHIPRQFLWPRSSLLFRVIGRVKPDVTLANAQAEMDLIAHQLREEYPNQYPRHFGIRLVPLLEQTVGNVKVALLVLQGAVGLLLLIVCANIVNLLLARNSGRTQEFAVRAAVGAGRAHLVRLLLVESVLLGLFGGLCGILVAQWGLSAMLTVAPASLPRAAEISLDGRVLCFTLGITILTSTLIGLAPAYSASRADIQECLKMGGRTQSWSTRNRMGSGVVVSQIALTLMLLVGAGLMTRSFQNLMKVDPGFDTENLLTFQLMMELTEGFDGRERAVFYRGLTDRLRAVPGVRAVAAGTRIPLKSWGVVCGPVHIQEYGPSLSDAPPAHQVAVESGYFKALDNPLLKGRLFDEHDVHGRQGAAIINEELARRFFPEEDPIGMHVVAAQLPTPDAPQVFEIVGVVGNARRHMRYEWEPHIYFPIEQQTWQFMGFGVRTEGDPLEVVSAVRHELATLTKDEAPFLVTTTDQTIADQLARERFAMFLLCASAAVALTLAAAGIYGVLSYSVERKTHEIDVRMALGAQPGSVQRLVFKQILSLTAIGLGVGLALSLAGSQLLSSLLYEVGATDPTTFMGVSLVMIVVALLACLLPARRATKVDPMVALRCE
jgi:putative ABC transport system permease protein